jgi:pimeloyl-ACP methyl ester carboxylesterase
MANQIFDTLWHRGLGRPYRLAKTVDTGAGATVVLLHGIGRSAEVWSHVAYYLHTLPIRIVAYDLLGFGKSPKPSWPKYDVDIHAQAVIASLRALKPGGKVVLVGHSMGCLVAVRVARLRPDLVRHLVLYEMPLYEGLPEKRRYKLRLNLYKRLYEAITEYQPSFDAEKVRLAERIAVRIAGFEVTRSSWQPFVRSLRNTIMNQTTAEDIKQLKIPMDVIYGTLDMLVIRGKVTEMFGVDNEFVTAHAVRAKHQISPKASFFIVSRIMNVLMPGVSLPAPEKPKRRLKRKKT